ncbi:TraB/GumN family protein [Bdellovibrio sp. HCB337]|uniref:TraB/GumN family protein n=1 Tax=Bdellovibrio sp. HCB337 TaxID=3394358 RepID=UPI0039A6DA0D
MKYGLLALFLVLIGCASSSSKIQKAYGQPVVTKFSKNWRSHYLVGTIHLPLDVEKMYPQLLPMIDESSAFVSEINFKVTDSLVMKQIESQRNYYAKGEGSLKNDLSPEAYAWVSEQLSDFSDKTFATLKPVRAWTLIQEKYKDAVEDAQKKLAEPADEAPIEGIYIHKDRTIYDAQLEAYARSKNKKIVALETGKESVLQKCFQLQAIFSLENVTYTLKKSPTSQPADDALKKYKSCLLAERNREWIQTLKPLLEKEDKVFIAVGMAHLYSKQDKANSLITLLEGEGYKVQIVSPEPNR